MQEAPVFPQVLNRSAASPSPATIAALTLDLDDTLWPILPVIERCESVLHAFLVEHAPSVAERFPRPAMRSLRDQVFAERPDLAHDYGAVRRACLERAFQDCALDAPDLLDQAYRLFYATRNQVELYAEVGQVLPSLAAHRPILALTNGNADIERIGVHDHFRGAVFARDVGCAKPDRRIFEHACDLLGVTPAHVLHVGDDARLDVLGARFAGLRTAWLNRERRPWPYPDGPQPDLIVHDLTELDHWLTGPLLPPRRS